MLQEKKHNVSESWVKKHRREPKSHDNKKGMESQNFLSIGIERFFKVI
jgi:hypothetical protein